MYMNDFCIFYREHTKEDGSEVDREGDNEVGGISVSKLLSQIYPNESFNRFKDLSVPFGIQFSPFPEVDAHQRLVCDDDATGAGENPYMDEPMFSKMFYSVAKDLGASSNKNGSSRRTKKKRS
jgi:hypothetical protein